jgi:peptidoglycan LD-endopeptidase CwlK
VIHHEERFVGVDPRLVSIARAVGQYQHFAVIFGVRDQASQMQAFAERRSKLQWPESKHNICPPERDCAEAIDLAPWPINFSNERAFIFLAGSFLQEARRQGVLIRWGGDWSLDGIGDAKDDRFQDLGHFEIIHQPTTTEEA